MCICTREAVRIMKDHNVAGHIINMNSVVGHYIPMMTEPLLNVYPASKFAVTALTETLRQELRYYKSKIKVTVSLYQKKLRKVIAEHQISSFIFFSEHKSRCSPILLF